MALEVSGSSKSTSSEASVNVRPEMAISLIRRWLALTVHSLYVNNPYIRISQTFTGYRRGAASHLLVCQASG